MMMRVAASMSFLDAVESGAWLEPFEEAMVSCRWEARRSGHLIGAGRSSYWIGEASAGTCCEFKREWLRASDDGAARAGERSEDR